MRFYFDGGHYFHPAWPFLILNQVSVVDILRFPKLASTAQLQIAKAT